MRRLAHLLVSVSLLVFATAFAAGCGDEEDPPPSEPPSQPAPDNDPAAQQPTQQDLGKAGVDPATGAYQGLELDTREGTAPPAAGGSLEQAARAAGCTLQLNLPDELDPVPTGRTHLAEGEPAPDYGTNPPTSGRHASVPLADGAYLETPPDVNYVHSLEHGRVEVQYASSLPESQQLALKGVFDADPDGMLLFPNDKMPYAVAATAWTNLIGCKEVSDPKAVAAAVLAFRDRFRGKGPERIPL